MISWENITLFGDTVVMLPVAMVIFAWLAASRAWRLACWWGALLGLGLAIVLMTKIAFIGWGIGIEQLDFTGISGHAMRASAVLPVAACLLLQQARPSTRTSGIVLGMALGALIGQSRLALHVHSPSEVIAGCLLGALISLGFIRMAQAMPHPHCYRGVHRTMAALTMFALLPAAYAEPAPTQRWITSAALYLSGHDKPYVRPAGRLAHASRVLGLPGE